MDFVVAVIITAIVTYFVVQDAKMLRDEEIETFGSSSVNPALWGNGVFWLLIIFLPAYILMRASHNRQLASTRIGTKAAPAFDRPDPSVLGSTLDEIARAHALLEKGAITQEEFEFIKAAHLECGAR